MKTQRTHLQFGTLGWGEGFEQANFFPEDLPDEWRLTYLSNEFNCVAISVVELQSLDVDVVEEWVDDTHDQFGFYLRIDAVLSQESLFEKLSPLKERLRGILLEDGVEAAAANGVRFIDLKPVLIKGESMESVVRLVAGEGVALIELQQPLAPMEVRRVVERLRELSVDTLLFVPSAGLMESVATFETISSLLG
ncbi:MAG: hypothetical protein HON68_05265 [Gammaproteobacteria bacterium]|nr:hypothetical protein [Gammaproteobacteria bacterium]MBT3489402.1 hypothetical protein [Gammaproteobacteria bacterium]MBT3718331.1 hypothetical protein [Gammaproteobacteria bacterium]MBT3844064.1 hypothetical protein [Gammaproteobacteria bacterium]MBT3892208.1 hypothetical protein [Gammaproteobacteria bacterium]